MPGMRSARRYALWGWGSELVPPLRPGRYSHWRRGQVPVATSVRAMAEGAKASEPEIGSTSRHYASLSGGVEEDCDDAHREKAERHLLLFDLLDRRSTHRARESQMRAVRRTIETGTTRGCQSSSRQWASVVVR